MKPIFKLACELRISRFIVIVYMRHNYGQADNIILNRFSRLAICFRFVGLCMLTFVLLVLNAYWIRYVVYTATSAVSINTADDAILISLTWHG